MKEKYTLRKIEREERVFEIIIEGDCNDGDYSSTVEEWSEKRFENRLPFLVALKKLEDVRHGNSEENRLEEFEKYYESEIAEYLDENLYEYVDIPSDDWGECHTITSVLIRLFDTDGSIYIVDLNMDIKPTMDEKSPYFDDRD